MADRTTAVIVRPVRPTDAAQLRDHCFSANTLAEVEARIAHYVRTQQQSAVLLVAEVDGVVVGTGTLARRTHPLHVHRGEVNSLVVHPDHQRQGMARRIIEAMRGYASSMGIEILETSCRGGTPAEHVYPRLGFIEYGRLPGGIVEPWGERRQTYDEVYFYQPVDSTPE
jgi:GNAT superfamily N-acetyltransferase